MSSDADIEAAIIDLLSKRAPTASICPSEGARRIDAVAWRGLMPQVRRVAAGLAGIEHIRATQGESVIEADSIVDTKGPLRLRRGACFPECDGTA